jgi:hypothetical protein
MIQECIDDKFCKHCQKETSHKITDSGHERDSSGDYFECLECHWWGTGLADEYYPPSDDVPENGT